MIVGLVVVGLCLVALPGVRWCSWDRLSSIDRLRLSTAAVTVGTVAVVAAGLVALAPIVLRGLGFHRWAQLCEHLFIHRAPFSWFVASMMTVVVAWVGLQSYWAVRDWRRTRTASFVEPWLGEHVDLGAFEFVVLPTARPLAYSTCSATAQVVISQGLIDLLSEPELEAVIAHEQAHLDQSHARHLLIATIADRVFANLTLVTRSTGAIRDAVELAADDRVIDARRRALRSATSRTLSVEMAAPPVHDVDGLVSRMAPRHQSDATTWTRAWSFGTVGVLALAAVALAVIGVGDGGHVFAVGNWCFA